MLTELLEASRGNSLFLAAELLFGVPAIIYLTWRLWQFTLIPWLHPERPKELPYTIPYIGHGIEYVKNGRHLVNRARIQLGNTREPFALTAGGRKLYFLTKHTDVAAMYKDTVALDFHTIVRPLVLMYGMRPEAVDRSYRVPPSAAEDPVTKALGFTGEKPKALAFHTHDIEQMELLPGPRFARLEAAVVQSCLRSLSLTEHDPYYLRSKSTDYETVSLYAWTSFVLRTAVPDAIFGPKLAKGNTKLLESFDQFAKYNWKLWYGWKDADDVRNAKEAYVAEIKKFLDLPLAKREPEESELWRKLEKAFVAAGLTKEDIVQRAGLLFWVSNSNPSRLTFWILNFLLFRREMYERLRQEILAVYSDPAEAPDTDKLTQNCPFLNAVVEESLRLMNGGESVRIVTAPEGIKFGDKVIPCGGRIFAPRLQLHTNPDAWPEAESFQPDRWLAKEVVGKREHYKPFGGGATMCPGRFLAKSSIRCFLAVAMTRFEMELEPGQVQAEVKVDEPVQGPMFPKDGMDVLVRVRRRV